MIDYEQAREIAEAWVRHRYPEGDVILQDELTREEQFGWAFLYDSRDYIASGHFRDQLFGNAPIVVMKDSGEVRVTGTSEPLEYYLEQLRSGSA